MADQEKCPKCGQLHTRSEYHRRPSEGIGPVHCAPYDIVCDCGLSLRWSVPIFKMTESGYVLRPLQDNETLFTAPKNTGE